MHATKARALPVRAAHVRCASSARASPRKGPGSYCRALSPRSLLQPPGHFRILIELSTCALEENASVGEWTGPPVERVLALKRVAAGSTRHAQPAKRCVRMGGAYSRCRSACHRSCCGRHRRRPASIITRRDLRTALLALAAGAAIVAGVASGTRAADVALAQAVMDGAATALQERLRAVFEHAACMLRAVAAAAASGRAGVNLSTWPLLSSPLITVSCFRARAARISHK